jgi:hypothetical protein
MNNFAHDIAVITRSLDLKDRRIAELETMLAVRQQFDPPPAAGVPYPNAALTEVCSMLLDEWDLTIEQVANLAGNLAEEYEAHCV